MLYRIDNDSLFQNDKTMYANFKKGCLMNEFYVTRCRKYDYGTASILFFSCNKKCKIPQRATNKIKKAILKYEQDIVNALYLDLRKSEFEAYATEIGIVLDSISYMVKHVEEWMEPEAVKTPIQYQMGKSFVCVSHTV